MTFFDKKEEVLDIQLTPFGKQMLSIGKFKPVYYAFYDNNILYDGAHAGIEEVQNDIEERIQDNTPQNKTQHSFSSREHDFSKYLHARDDLSLPEIDRIRIQATPEKEFSLVRPMGTSDLDSTQAPNWKITLLEGEIEKASHFLTSSFQDLPIPQLDINFTYTTKVVDNSTTPSSFIDPNSTAPDDLTNYIFSDGSRIDIDIKDGYSNLLFMVEEGGTPFQKENFDVEVYYVEPSDGSYTPLSFTQKMSNIINGLFVPESQRSDTNIDETYVEFFFDLNTDTHINKRDLCEGIQNVKSQGLYIDSELDCIDTANTPTTLSPYSTNTSEPDCSDK